MGPRYGVRSTEAIPVKADSAYGRRLFVRLVVVIGHLGPLNRPRPARSAQMRGGARWPHARRTLWMGEPQPEARRADTEIQASVSEPR